MCCIFTCCGWMIDLVQRLWTFTMACCISSAVCCALVTASMSGIALGYNYSLAEYIDLKETNVSVYLKRGIFDDEIGDDMDWRRSGHQPVAGHIGEGNLRTGAPDDESTTIRSGRRLDDSIYESDDRNKFEGSLMRLTAKAPAPSSTDQTETPVDADEVLSKYTMDSLDQMKAIQGMINMRKSADPRLRISKEGTKTTPPFVDERYLPHGPLNRDYIAPGRKHMPVYDPKGYNTPGDSARYAVPGEPINEPAKWYRPRLKTEDFVLNKHGDFDARATYPAPVTIREGPVRPSRPKPRPKPTLTAPPPTTLLRPELNYPKSIDEDMDTFKDKILLDKFNSPSFNQEDFEKHIKAHKPDEDYEDAIKGIPSRKKRHSGNFENTDNSEKQISPLGSVPNKTMNVNSNESLFNKLRKPLSDIMSIDRNNNVTSSTIQHENNTSTILPSISNSMSSNIVLRLLKSTTT